MNLWHCEVAARSDVPDTLGIQLEAELERLDLVALAPVRTARVYLLAGAIDGDAARRLVDTLLVDSVVQEATLLPFADARHAAPSTLTICRKAGVMDPVTESIERAAARLGTPLDWVRVGTVYRFAGNPDASTLMRVGTGALANPVVDEILVERTYLDPGHGAPAYEFERIEVPLPLDDDALVALSRSHGLSLNLAEMRAIRRHFEALGRTPTDIELETLAQTWSEHCKHKTFGAVVQYGEQRFDNLLKSTIFEATRRLDRDFCISVFKDNAGIVAFDGENHLCFKVETHNHPSAIEPYGGAGTGLGGVIRDILGTGLGAKPVANTDVFCVGRLDAEREELPSGVIHPLRVLKGVVSGVRDYGNRMGIPTVNGAVFVDERYTGNPLVYCGTIGIIPANKCQKAARPGDVIVAIGGRTGRDGIHGATFSSRELHEESEVLDGGAVQIGNAITEKRMMDVLLAARDRDLYTAVTDCGAGGFSSAIGEMGAEIGADVELATAPTKYPGLTYTEIWISEAQERMVLAVPPERLDELLALCRAEDVEACVLGTFTDDHRLRIRYDGNEVCNLEMHFLHEGCPKPELTATWSPPLRREARFEKKSTADALEAILASPNVASKEWIIRQYDHEVQSGSVVKPLVGKDRSGPSDAAVCAPIMGSTKGFAVANGMNPRYGDHDPYHMACAAIDEALRNVVAVGGDPDRTAILDNFSWGNAQKPDRLGALVRASLGCRDAAMALRTPFISGKDSLNNEYATANGTIVIPHSLLVSALAIVDDVRRCVTMDLKRSGSELYLVGITRREMGGSHWHLVHGAEGGDVPVLDQKNALDWHRTMHASIRGGHVLACHDCSEGGLLTAVAEMAFAGGFGAFIETSLVEIDGRFENDDEILFSESLTRWVVEVAPGQAAAFERLCASVPHRRIGNTDDSARLRVRARDGSVLLDSAVAALGAIHRNALSDRLEATRRG